MSGYSLALELEVVRLEPPQRADLRFEGSGFRAANHYTVVPAPAGARVTWAIEGDATSFKARLIAPMVQSKLQEKLDGDLRAAARPPGRGAGRRVSRRGPRRGPRSPSWSRWRCSSSRPRRTPAS